jgi:hypothetical protein
MMRKSKKNINLVFQIRLHVWKTWMMMMMMMMMVMVVVVMMML